MEARRSDKTFPMTSPELMRELGAYLLGKHNYLRVDVKNPQFKVIVEIQMCIRDRCRSYPWDENVNLSLG